MKKSALKTKQYIDDPLVNFLLIPCKSTKLDVTCPILTYYFDNIDLMGNIEYKIKFCETIIKKNTTRFW